MERCHFAPFHLDSSEILPQHTMFHFASEITLEENALCQLWYRLLLNQMVWKCEPRFYYIFVRAIDVKTRANLFIKRVKFRFCEILKTWSIPSLISMYATGLAGRENRPTPSMLFAKHPVFHFAPMFHFPLLTIMFGSLHIFAILYQDTFLSNGSNFYMPIFIRYASMDIKDERDWKGAMFT